MEELCNLYFELSNEDRLNILYLLRNFQMNLTTLSNELDIRNQQCSRHLARLSKNQFIFKNQEGNYELTPFGNALLIQVESQKFLVANIDYFQTHTVNMLPLEFVMRLGELSKATYINDAIVTMHNLEQLVDESEEYVLSMVNQYPINIYSLNREAWEKGVWMHVIEEKEWAPPEQFIDVRKTSEDDINVSLNMIPPDK